MNRAPDAEKLPRLGRRLAWFAGLWLASVLSLGVVALALRLVFNAIFRH